MHTQHARVRAQQRGIPPLIDEILDTYGREEYDGHGGIVLYLDKNSFRRMERDMGREPVRRIADWHSAYKVIGSSNGVTITCGMRYLRVKRK